MTLIGQNEVIKKNVLRMLSESLSMLEDSRKDIGRSYGTEPMPTNRMENGIKLLKAWCSILYFVPAAPWKEENWKAKEKVWKQR